MNKMLICGNSHCRFLLDLRFARKNIAHSRLVLGGCPECGHSWSSRCPSCDETLTVTWGGHQPSCTACKQPLHPQKARAHSRAA